MTFERLTFERFYDEVWKAKKHHVLLFKSSAFMDVWEWACDNEEGLWSDIPADSIVSIDCYHTDTKAKYFLSTNILRAEVVNLIILSGCVCVFIQEVETTYNTAIEALKNKKEKEIEK